jgi:hypothetical protein
MAAIKADAMGADSRHHHHASAGLRRSTAGASSEEFPVRPYAGKTLAALAAPDWLDCAAPLKGAIANAVLGEFKRLWASEGLRAFEQPRSAAVAHETGHAVVGHVLGDRITRVEITRNKRLERTLGVPVWCGYTYTSGEKGRGGWRVDEHTPIDEVRARICKLEAGACGEFVLDRDGYRSGSSLDERAVSQLIAAGLHARLGREGHPEETWLECVMWTAATIERCAAPARELMAKLDLMGSIQGKPLARILEQVRPLDEEGA